MAEKMQTCKCQLKNMENPNKCHCVMLNGTVVSKNKMVLEKRCIRYHCCVCASHPVIKKAKKYNKKGKKFDEKNFILFCLKQFNWKRIWESKPIEILAVTSENSTGETDDDMKIYCERCLFRTLESNRALKFGKDDNDFFHFALTLCGRHNK